MKERTISNVKTISLIQVALIAALTYIATAVISFPVGDNAVMHLGDAMVFISAVLLGKRKGAVAAAIGMTCFDLFSPYYIWAPFTFIIKGMMAYIAGTVAWRGDYEGDNVSNNIVAFIIAGLFMTAAYFIAGGVLNRFVYGIPTFKTALIVALKDVPANILQIVLGAVIAVPASISLKKHLKKYIVR